MKKINSSFGAQYEIQKLLGQNKDWSEWCLAWEEISEDAGWYVRELRKNIVK